MEKLYYCVVPSCKSNSRNCSDFLNFPSGQSRRKLWFNVIGIDPNYYSSKTKLNICGNHFNLVEDLKNYEKYRSGTGNKSFKKDVIPRFNLQGNIDMSPSGDEGISEPVMGCLISRNELSHTPSDDETTVTVCGQQEQIASPIATTHFDVKKKKILFYLKSSCQDSKRGLRDFTPDLRADQSETADNNDTPELITHNIEQNYEIEFVDVQPHRESTLRRSKLDSRMPSEEKLNKGPGSLNQVLLDKLNRLAIHHETNFSIQDGRKPYKSSYFQINKSKLGPPIPTARGLLSQMKKSVPTASFSTARTKTPEKRPITRPEDTQQKASPAKRPRNSFLSSSTRESPINQIDDCLFRGSSTPPYHPSSINTQSKQRKDFNGRTPQQCQGNEESTPVLKGWSVTNTPVKRLTRVSSSPLDHFTQVTSTPVTPNDRVTRTKSGKMKSKRLFEDENLQDSMASAKETTGSYYSPNSTSFCCSTEETFTEKSPDTSKRFAENSFTRENNRKIMERHPKVYLGINKTWLSILDLVSYKITVTKRCVLEPIEIVYLVLRKLKLNETFTILGHVFGISARTASRLFAKYLPFIADHFSELIVWPKPNSIRRALPIGFRKSYYKVVGIGDCLEIEIQKPMGAVAQSMTWSSYKNTNTIKVFVVVTPNGLFMFVSVPYCGRATDEMITADCGFLDLLQPGMELMVDRGFKKIENMVLAKKARLVRPPSVSTGVKLSKSKVMEARKIAGLRIHVERAIRRIREFRFLSPHACLPSYLVRHANDAMRLVCGLINLQPSLIK